MQRMWRDADAPYPIMTEAQLEQSLDAILGCCPSRGDVWVFGYGSLIWNPLLDYDERLATTLHGYHRRFCLWSRIGRGTPDHPGLVLALDRGGCCRGMAYRIGAAKARDELALLWRREMLAQAYLPKWLTVRAGENEICALAFVINRSHPAYTGKLCTDDIVDVLATAAGHLGSSRDYLCRTVESLIANGISDPRLHDLRERVTGRAETVEAG
jgi:glutathione-specific gamma-glutamylcyclotransferase